MRSAQHAATGLRRASARAVGRQRPLVLGYGETMARPRSFDQDDVLRAARDQFWSTGYTGTSVDDILGKPLWGMRKGANCPIARRPPGWCAPDPMQVMTAADTIARAADSLPALVGALAGA